MKDIAKTLGAMVSISVLATNSAMARGLRLPPGKPGASPMAAQPGFGRTGAFNHNFAGAPNSGAGRFGRHNAYNSTNNNSAAAAQSQAAHTSSPNNGQYSNYPKNSSAYQQAPQAASSSQPATSYQPAPQPSSYQSPPPQPASYPATAPTTAAYPATTTATVPPPGTYTLNVVPPYAQQAYAQPASSAAPYAIMGGAMLGSMLGGAAMHNQGQGQNQQQPANVTNNYYTETPASPNQPITAYGQPNATPPTNAQVSGQVVPNNGAPNGQQMGPRFQRFLQARKSFMQQQQQLQQQPQQQPQQQQQQVDPYP